ncbi:hypothetical protein PLESTB_000570000 [Pleodorina starrii]|uniref:N-acetyltransferase domain-containing protein n=1 Tax=Pleodorina starrii TaxID=330485 RepID=A0A9W6BH73_9CHLO|nr:hypothetical protein PLESTM_000314700 [Pleodorina starrii]GLC51984.1 hypothetical protein PLESTB_000570000 [Pleodorina starrii]GLC72127.1 hypothetical protein PLESTF_001210100 [Pleodorina starrii]
MLLALTCGTTQQNALPQPQPRAPPAPSRSAVAGRAPAALPATRRQACRQAASGSSSSVSTAGGFSTAARSRWLPDQPTFVCPPSIAPGSPTPSDEAWAEQGIFFSYGKAHLSYNEVEQLLQLANLHVSPADFRAATVVVWAYRYRPETTADAAFPDSSISGDGGAPEVELVGFASADVAPAPAPTRLTPAGAGGGGAAEGSMADLGRSGGGGGQKRRPSADDGSGGADSRRWGDSRRHRPVGHDPRDRELRLSKARRGGGRDAELGGSGGGVAADSASPDVAPPDMAAAAAAATIWFLAVHPDLRRRGLGRALLERVASELYDKYGRPLLVSLRATSLSAAFYDRLGLRRDPAAPLVRSAGGGAA